jgi:hypothetical protein
MGWPTTRCASLLTGGTMTRAELSAKYAQERSNRERYRHLTKLEWLQITWGTRSES